MDSYQQSEDRKQSNHNLVSHHLKQINLQLKQSEAQPFVIDYLCEVIQPNLINLIVYAIITYFLYVFIEVFMFNVQGTINAQNQGDYLISLHHYFSIDQESKINRVKTFVDIYLQVSAFDSDNLSTNVICNRRRYLCKQGSYISLPNFVENQFNIVKNNYQMLIKEISLKSKAQIFLYNSEWTFPFLIYNFDQQNQLNIAERLATYIDQQKQSDYIIMPLKKVISSSNYEIKILLCGRVLKIKFNVRICVITPGSMQQQIMSKQNPIKLIASQIITITLTSIQNVSQDRVNSVDRFLKQAIYSFVTAQDQQFYLSFPFKQCISEYYVKQYFAKNKIKICSPPQILYLMTPLTIFINFYIELSSKHYSQDVELSETHNHGLKLNFLILSNKTFMQNQGIRLKNNNLKHSLISILLTTTIVLWVVIMSYFPLKFVGEDISLSVSLMIKLCKSVKHIKNKDDLEQQIDIFNKLNIQINKKDHIFYQTIQYFKYFIWYRKLIYATKNRKKKSLLDQGLSLFGSSDFAPVLMYIYKKQIERQIRLVTNYKKMRKIFTQNFMIFQNYDKIQALKLQKAKMMGNKIKKSGFNQSYMELDQDSIYGRDFCMIQNVQNRINKQLQFLQIQKKSKRNVRFSHDHQQQQKPFQYKLSKFVLNLPSQILTQKNSQKSIEQQIIKRQQKEKQKERQSQVGSNAVQSSREQKLFSQVRDQESQKSQKKDQHQNWNMFLKFDQTDEENSFDAQQDECFELKRYSLKKLQEKVSETYELLFRTYQKMIVIKKMSLDKQQIYQILDYINELYKMHIQKLRYAYKYIKHRNNQRQRILKQLSRKLIHIKRQKTNLKDIELSKKQKLVGSEKWIQENISIIEEQIFQQGKLIDIQFKQFHALQQKYKIDPFLIDKAKIYQIKVLKVLNYPIPYKKLQNLCDSINQYIRVQARVIMAAQFFHISPHADIQALQKVHENLLQNNTTHNQKQKTLKLLKKVLQNREKMQQQQNQIQLIRNFYNYSHKKFYFIVDLSDNYEVFQPTLSELYKNMGTVDMYQILNLAMNEVVQDMIASGNEIKPSKFSDFEIKFKNIHSEANKIKSMASAKTGSRKMAYQKDFNRILSKVQQENVSLSKFIVIILGGQNQFQSKTHQDHESSSAQNRQVYQIIHQQILSRMQKNYFHIILVGFNLKDYQTRQGKIKKYVKHSYSILEIDLSKSNIESFQKQLGRFLNK